MSDDSDERTDETSGHDHHAHQDDHGGDDGGHGDGGGDHGGDSGGHDAYDHGGHDHHATDVETVGAAILTVSSSRSLNEDPAGDTIGQAFEHAGHEVSTRALVADEHDNVQAGVDSLVDRGDTDVVVTTGGTGVTPDDVTIEAVTPLFKKDLPGFGELFRRRSYGEVGARIVATRASAGIVSEVPVFCLPGSENAARLGSEIVTEVCGHLAGLARRDEETH
jgi:molybdenum cofactor biosynthesis protein B